MPKLFRYRPFKDAKKRSVSDSQGILRKPIVFYNRQKKRIQIAWMRVTTVMILLSMMIGECGAPTIQEQLAASKALLLGDMTTLGVGGGTIVGAIIAIVRQSPALLFIVMGIGFGLSMYMKWIKDYNFGG